jgi:hypothetical protein
MTDAVKNTAILYGIKPEMVLCHQVVAAVFHEHYVPCVITDGPGDGHGKRSLHPVGYALDYRTKHITGWKRETTIRDLVKRLKEALPQCDVVLEDLGGDNEHIHIEFDPKNDKRFQDDKQTYKVTGKWPA